MPRLVLTHRELSYNAICWHLTHYYSIHISCNILSRIVKAASCKCCRVSCKPFLSPLQHCRQVQYAHQHLHVNCHHVISVNEACVATNGAAQCWVTLSPSEKYIAACLQPCFPKTSTVKLWVAIWHGGKSELVILDTLQSDGACKGVMAKLYSKQGMEGPSKNAVRHRPKRGRGRNGIMVRGIGGIQRSGQMLPDEGGIGVIL